jgi:hypothetical protein
MAALRQRTRHLAPDRARGQGAKQGVLVRGTESGRAQDRCRNPTLGFHPLDRARMGATGRRTDIVRHQLSAGSSRVDPSRSKHAHCMLGTAASSGRSERCSFWLARAAPCLAPSVSPRAAHRQQLWHVSSPRNDVLSLQASSAVVSAMSASRTFAGNGCTTRRNRWQGHRVTVASRSEPASTTG